LLGGLKPAPGEKRLVALMDDKYALGRLEIVLDDPLAVPEQQIVLKKGHSVRGQALCTDGKPASGWRISALPTWWRLGIYPSGQVIGPDGSFELLHVGDDRYDVTISIPTSDSGFTPKTVLAGAPLPADGDPLTLTVDSPSPAAMTKIKGHIEYEGGKLERGFHVMAFSTTGNHHGDAFVRPGETEFEIGPVPPGTYKIDFNSQEIEAQELRNVVVPTKPLEVKITVRGTLSLRGTVVDGETGNPVPKFSLQVTKLQSLRGPNYVQKPEWHAFASEGGAFAVDIVGPGIYSLNVAADGFAPGGLDGINTDTGPTKDLKIVLTTGQSLSGTVVDEAGQPVDGAQVTPVLPGAGAPGSAAPPNGKRVAKDARTALTAQGAFTIPHFALGKEGLQITHADFATLIVPPVAAPKEDRGEPLSIRLVRGAKVHGHVYDEEGQPVGNTPLYFNRHRYREQAQNDPTSELAKVVTDKQGSYEADHLPEDDCYVSRADAWKTLGVVRQMIRTEKSKTITLDFGGTAKTTGRLLVNGKPAANTRLVVSGESPNFGPLRACALTDGKGAFVFRGIPPGERTLYYWPTADQREAIAAVTFDAARDGNDLGTIELALVRVALLKPDHVEDGQVRLEPYDANWFFGRGGTMLRPDRKPDEPLAFAHVKPGKYDLFCSRPEQFLVRQTVEVTAAPEQTVALKVPKGTASLAGKCDKSICGPDGPRNLYVWSKDERLLGFIVPKEDGSYRLENIPAGEYLIRRYPPRDSGVILRVSLKEGQNKELDITPENASRESMQPKGHRYVSFYTADGLTLPGCKLSFPEAEHPPAVQHWQDGRLLFVGPRDGRYEMTITYPGFKPLRQTLELRPIGMSAQKEDSYLRVFLQPE
ncbi:MAG TPA: carboxypeptidase-like regulatory domain-containing protein, partial [Pirellulales bacterium]|nr:carboxypeptidase-like regulatory domain-containing protein [Pirellulales bacterium]